MALLVIMAAEPLRLNDARDTDMLIVFIRSKDGMRDKSGDEGDEGNDGITYAVGYTSEMESGPMVDESWQQRKCDGLVLFAIRYYKYNLQNQH